MTRKLITSIFLSIVVCFTLIAHTPVKNLDGDIKLMIGNDLGRNGYYEQKKIAELMGEMADEVGPEAFLALGDTHHFLGVASVDDPLWMTNYELIYSHPELQINWYPILGNHEYRGNSQAVIDYSKISRRWNMPARYYSKIFEEDGTRIKIIFIDTTPIIDKYHEKNDKYPNVCQQDVEAQLKWLDEELGKNEDVDWTVVVGHHPIYADTEKESEEREDMVKKVDPILRKYKVDMYICGHIHNFQHIKQNGIDYIVNSSASLSRKKVSAVEGTVFYNGDSGFSILTATKKNLSLSMINHKGNIIHQVTRTK